MIDLGLTSGNLWANYNIGVDPTDLDNAEDWYGNYYAWGETQVKYNGYTGNNYKYRADGKYTKYVTSTGLALGGHADGKTELVANDDVATYTYGSDYRMPNKTDLHELIDETDNELVSNYNGIIGLNGYKFMKKTDHSVFIFIPQAGYYYGSEITGQPGIWMWTSTLANGGTAAVSLRNNFAYDYGDDRCSGLSVRAIKYINQ